MSSQIKQQTQNAKRIFGGIDVGAEELVLVIRRDGVSDKARTFTNNSADHARLVKKLLSLEEVTVCLEATGVYHFDLSVAIHDAGIKLMVINPKASHNFSKALMKNSKSDAIDADTLAIYAERMDFVAWIRPSKEKIATRSLSRRINTLTRQKAASKNHLHALKASGENSDAVLADAHLAISQLEQRIDNLTKSALIMIEKYHEINQIFNLLLTVTGIAATSGIALIGEILLLPPGLTPKQWVKSAGLDPRIFESGKSVHKQARLAKAGNGRLRAALYMPALSAKRHDPNIKAYAQHLTDKGKKPLQVICAVMRKMLHAIHGMLKNNQPFDGSRFYALPS